MRLTKLISSAVLALSLTASVTSLSLCRGENGRDGCMGNIARRKLGDISG